MRQSQLFGKTLRESPKDELSTNARLLIKGGFIDKLMAGAYSYLPLGWRVYKKIEQIIREEMNAIGGQELYLPALHPRENWEKTGRWEVMDDLYKLEDTSGRQFALAGTHEEVVTPLAAREISSYRDLPMAVYQFQNKFRMELRAKSGILRGREFIMKDLYSFHATEEDLNLYYETVKESYRKIFDRSGIGAKTVVTLASGGTFSKYSHEFQTLTSAGEDIIYLCESCNLAINDEIIEEQAICPGCGAESSKLKKQKAIEVGNIFPLKTKYSSAFSFTYKDDKGNDQPVIMGCYGIGLGRLMGAIVETHHDDKGIIWPKTVAPFDAHLLVLGEDAATKEQADILYRQFITSKTGEAPSLLYDDRNVSAGIKLNDADLLGIPWRIVVSAKTAAKGVLECQNRASGEIKFVDGFSEIVKLLC